MVAHKDALQWDSKRPLEMRLQVGPSGQPDEAPGVSKIEGALKIEIKYSFYG